MICKGLGIHLSQVLERLLQLLIEGTPAACLRLILFTVGGAGPRHRPQQTTWLPLLRFADPLRLSILFPNLANAGQEALRTHPSRRWSAVGRFCGERERGRLDYHA